MSELPDTFDLWVRRARKAGPERQVDFLLGSLFGLTEWFFMARGPASDPVPALAEIEGEPHLLLFSTARRLEDFTEDSGHRKMGEPLPVISMSAEVAAPYILELGYGGCRGLLVNPGDYAFQVRMESFRYFYEEWMARGARIRQGFWIPNMTTEEDDFWQEHGID